MATKKLMLDAGHGLKTAGKQTPDGIKEFTLNQNVVDYIIDNLKNYDVEIKLSHDRTGNTDTPLLDRVNNCNNYLPDVFVSIHHNAFTGTWGTANGTEVFYHTSGKVENKKLANIIAPKLAANTGLRDRGVKANGYTVLTCKATSALVEGGFMDSKSDYDIITSADGQKAYAKAVSDSLIEYMKLAEGSATTPSDNRNASDATTTFKVGTYNSFVEITAAPDLNVRAARNATSDIVAKLPKGTIIQVGYIMYENDKTSGTALWGGVNVSGKQGFIHLGYAKAVAAPSIQYYAKPSITALLTAALDAIKVDSSFTNREKIAKANNITNYSGTDEQNTKLFDLLRDGALVKA